MAGAGYFPLFIEVTNSLSFSMFKIKAVTLSNIFANSPPPSKVLVLSSISLVRSQQRIGPSLVAIFSENRVTDFTYLLYLSKAGAE